MATGRSIPITTKSQRIVGTSQDDVQIHNTSLTTHLRVCNHDQAPHRNRSTGHTQLKRDVIVNCPMIAVLLKIYGSVRLNAVFNLQYAIGE